MVLPLPEPSCCTARSARALNPFALPELAAWASAMSSRHPQFTMNLSAHPNSTGLPPALNYWLSACCPPEFGDQGAVLFVRPTHWQHEHTHWQPVLLYGGRLWGCGHQPSAMSRHTALRHVADGVAASHLVRPATAGCRPAMLTWCGRHRWRSCWQQAAELPQLSQAAHTSANPFWRCPGAPPPAAAQC